MAFTLENLGLNINKHNNNFRENVINYCIQRINNERITISTQLLLSQKNNFSDDIEKQINNELLSNLLNRRNNFLKNLSNKNFEEKFYNFMTNYLEGLKNIDIIFSLSDNNLEMKYYGNSSFIQSNIEQFSDMIIFYPKIKKMLSKYLINNIITNDELRILKIFKKLEKYKLVIFDELTLDLIEWSLNEQEIPEIYPGYDKDILKLGYNIYKIKKINYFVNKNFPKKNYSNIYIKILDIIFDTNIPNILKHSNTGLGLLKRYLGDLMKIIKFCDNDKAIYYMTYLDNKVKFIFRKINNLDNFRYLLELYDNYIFTHPEISSLIFRKKDDKIFKNILNTILNLDLNQLKIFCSLLTKYVVKIREELLITLKYQLSENIWNLNTEQLFKIYEFILSLNFKSENINMIGNLIIDKKKCIDINQIISPHKVYHFSRGIWDYPMDNDYLIINNTNFNDSFKEEIDALKLSFNENNKDIVLFMTKGSFEIELQDNIGKLNSIFLPIQAFIIKKLINGKIHKDKLTEYIKILGVDNYSKVIETINDLIDYTNNEYSLKEKLPYYGEKNFANLYFIETQKIINKKIKDDIVFDLNDFLSTTIISILKKETNKLLEKNKLLNRLNELGLRDFTVVDFENIIKILEEKDYIIVHDDIISYQVY